jgi:hypothetical protein
VARYAFDGTSNKYLNFDGGTQNGGSGSSGLTVTTGGGVVTSLGLTIPGDWLPKQERNPATYTLSGSNDGANFTAISSGAVPKFGPAKGSEYREVSFANDVAYTTYKVMFTVLLPSIAMQIQEIELFQITCPPLTDADFKRATWDWVNLGAATATVKWGVIKDWDTSFVKDMSSAFDKGRNPEANELVDFNNDKGEGQVSNYKDHTTAIGFNACTSGGSVFSKITFSPSDGSVKIKFDFAAAVSGSYFIGYSDGTPGSNNVQVTDVTPSLVADGNWNTYTDTHTCLWSQCHIMLGCSSAAVYFDNFVIKTGNNKVTDFVADLSKWKTAAVTSMRYMFRRARKFNSNLDSWDTSQVAGSGFGSMFEYANEFNSDLQTWNVAKVTRFDYMFKGATKFLGRGVAAWDIAKVTPAADSLFNIFKEATSITPCNKRKIFDSWTRVNAAALNPDSSEEVDCLKDAEAAFGNGVTENQPLLQKGDWADKTGGCSVKSGGDGPVNYNIRTTVPTQSGYLPVPPSPVEGWSAEKCPPVSHTRTYQWTPSSPPAPRTAYSALTLATPHTLQHTFG